MSGSIIVEGNENIMMVLDQWDSPSEMEAGPIFPDAKAWEGKHTSISKQGSITKEKREENGSWLDI